LRLWGTAPVSLFPLKYLQTGKTKSPFTMVTFVKTSCGKNQSMLTYRILRFGSCAKASGTVPVNSLFDKSLKENVKKKQSHFVMK